MRGPVDVHRLLVDAGVPHEVVHSPRHLESAADLPHVLGVAPAACVVLDVYESDAGHVAVLRPADRAPAPVLLAAAIGVRTLRAASPGIVSMLTDCTAAYAAPVGLPPHVAVLADDSLTANDVVYTAAGDGATALKVRPDDLIRLTGATVAPIAVPRRAEASTRA